MAKLVQSSRLPSLGEVAPYREALVQHLYEVLPKDKDDRQQDFPIGSRIAVTHTAEGRRDRTRIWVVDVARGTMSPLPREGFSGPVWTPARTPNR